MRVDVEIRSILSVTKDSEEGKLKNCAIVAFADDEDGFVNYSHNEPVFMVQVMDENYQNLSASYEDFFPQVNELVLFINKYINLGYKIICQCEYGVSRSSGCAAAIKEFYERSGIEIFSDYRYRPNQVIFHKLMDAFEKLYN